MKKITLGIDGMACGMCESHINDAIRNNYSNIKKVTSNHKKNETIIICEDDIAESDLANTIKETGYSITSYMIEEYKKKGLFGL